MYCIGKRGAKNILPFLKKVSYSFSHCFTRRKLITEINLIKELQMNTLSTKLVNQALSQSAQMQDLDRLGLLQAQAAELNEQIEQLKDVFKNAGEGTYEADLYKATVTLAQRSSYDYKQMVADLGITTEQLQKYYKSTATISIRVTAR